MRLGIDQLKTITTGAYDIVNEDGAFRFLRMKESQSQEFDKEGERFYAKSKATASVKLDFYTDSKWIKIGYNTTKASSSTRTFYSFDVLEDGELSHSHFGNFPGINDNVEFEAKLCGNKRVSVYFPNTYMFKINFVELEDGAFIKPAEFDIKMMMFGDSITHGYDAVFSSGTYANIVARKLNANMRNIGLAAGKFNPAIVEAHEGFDPDIVTVAYGTNDWSGRDPNFKTKCTEFLNKLAICFKNAKVYVILPIWRGHLDENDNMKSFMEYRKFIADTAEKNGFVALESIDYVPHDATMYTDLLHPNDAGFKHFANNLLKDIK